IARPIPREPPVTPATFPFSDSIRLRIAHQCSTSPSSAPAISAAHLLMCSLAGALPASYGCSMNRDGWPKARHSTSNRPHLLKAFRLGSQGLETCPGLPPPRRLSSSQTARETRGGELRRERLFSND